MSIDSSTAPAANATAETATTANNDGTGPNNITKRRILKATPPTALPDTTTFDGTTNVNKDDVLLSPSHDYISGSLEQSMTDQEMLQESIKADRKVRRQQVHDIQKSKRQQTVNERRYRKSPTPNPVQANPFSRFLSAFSVEPPVPSHKRVHEDDDIDTTHDQTSDEDDHDDNEKTSVDHVDTKRLRTSTSRFGEEDNNDDDSEKDKEEEESLAERFGQICLRPLEFLFSSSSSSPFSSWLVAGAAVATIAVVAAAKAGMKRRP